MSLINRYLRAVLRRLCWGVCRLFPLKKKKVIFSNHCGRGYGGDPKYVADALLRLNAGLDLVWVAKTEADAATLPQGIRICKEDSMQQIYELSTAKVWVDNCRKPAMIKRKSQIYFHTWHGFSIKKIESDVPDKLSPGYVKAAIKDSKNMDYAVSCSSFMTGVFQNSFWYNGPVLEWGEPRNDFFFADQTDLQPLRRKVYEFFNLSFDTKLVIYAPTFRADGSMDAYSVDYPRLIAACEKRFGGNFVVLVRLHPNIAKQSEALGLDGTTVLNASHYIDAQELLAVADVVITDYSSIVVDFALSGKPGFLFATDFEEYKKDRDVYIALEDLPFSLSTNNDELERLVLSFDEQAYANRLEAFWNRVGMRREGRAGELFARLILEVCEGKRTGFEKKYQR